MAAALESRLQAAKNVLEGLGSADGATKARASSVHRSALVAMLKPMLSGLSDTNKADLTTMVNGIGWAGDDGQSICKLLLRDVTLSSSRVNRRPMQDFRSFLAFFTEDQWKTFLSQDVSMDMKETEIIATLVAGGCRCASEKTKVLAAEFWAKVSAQPGAPPEADLRALKKRLGDDLKAAGKRAGPPCVYLEVLSSAPSELKASHQELYDAMFPNSAPVPCKANQVALLTRVASKNCRGGGRALEGLSMVARTPTIQCDSGVLPQAAMERFGQMFVQGMEQISQNQARMMQMVMGRGQAGSHRTLTLDRLNGDRRPPRRALTFDRFPDLDDAEYSLDAPFDDRPEQRQDIDDRADQRRSRFNGFDNRVMFASV